MGCVFGRGSGSASGLISGCGSEGESITIGFVSRMGRSPEIALLVVVGISMMNDVKMRRCEEDAGEGVKMLSVQEGR